MAEEKDHSDDHSHSHQHIKIEIVGLEKIIKFLENFLKQDNKIEVKELQKIVNPRIQRLKGLGRTSTVKK